MDMWKAFEKSTRKNAPQAAILYDKFHVMRHLGEALDQVEKGLWSSGRGISSFENPDLHAQRDMN